MHDSSRNSAGYRQGGDTARDQHCPIDCKTAYVEEEDDRAKVAYMERAYRDDTNGLATDRDLQIANNWQDPPRDDREEKVRDLCDQADHKVHGIQRSHTQIAWSASSYCPCALVFGMCARQDGIAGTEVRQIARGVDGPSLELLAKKSEHIDTGVADLFKNGAPVVAELEQCPLTDCSLLPFAYGVCSLLGLA